MPLPETIRDEAHLEELLSEPSPHVIETLARLDGDFIFLGVGGKMGPTLARMARRALEMAGLKRRTYGAARFSQPSLVEQLRRDGIEPIRCDLLDRAQVANLPEVANVVVMAGMKFGATGQESLTWAMNAYVPALICERYRDSRVVAFSTGNVYGLCPLKRGGCRETDPLQPVGDYSQSALARERTYEHFCRTQKMPMVLLRLNYATEMRYGVLVDIAQRVLAEQPVDVTMGFLNSIWQGDANAMSLCAFAHLDTPAKVINIAGPETLSVRRIAEDFGALFGRKPILTGAEADDAFISSAQECHRRFGYPRVPVGQMVRWIADWLPRGGRTLGKPTGFQVRDGKF